MSYQTHITRVLIFGAAVVIGTLNIFYVRDVFPEGLDRDY